MIRYLACCAMALAVHGLVAGCGRQSAEREAAAQPSAVSVNTSRYLLSEEPDGAIGVISAREEAQDNEGIVVVGRIGGRRNPWVDGLAAFTLVDASMSVVADGTMDGANEICLDDCCAAARTGSTALVKVNNEVGQVLRVDARDLLDVQENDMVVVRGQVKRDADAGSFSIVADGVYVRR